MSNYKYLHFTLGPVQGFVAQARRTRDLWAGSFLLSYLAGQAMYAVIKAGGTIIIPDVYDNNDSDLVVDPLLRAIRQHNEGISVEEHPCIGSLPNRFKARVPAGFNPESCCEAVNSAWQNIAQTVWDEYLTSAAKHGRDVYTIWQRQTENFWDMAWVTSDLEQSDYLLDRRKNWRSYVPPKEPGDKCTVMGNLQELSGYIGSKGKNERDKQRDFWAKLQAEALFDLHADERLCAIALIKRLFPRIAKEAIGWPVPVFYPSTSYLAAVPWLTEAIIQNNKWCEQYADKVQTDQTLVKLARSQSVNTFKCVAQAVNSYPNTAKFAKLEGNFFYPPTLANHRMWPPDTEKCRNELITLLKKCKTLPGSFYALLLMDGDRLGALLQSHDTGGEEISRALAQFTHRVPTVVQENNGVLIYAGGDDVLALVTLENAIPLAVQLRQEFNTAFSKTTNLSDKASISAAIIYAHHHAPLKSVLRQAHKLLDNVAKEETGRDSLAVGVWNSAGLMLQWANPWEKIISGNSTLIEKLVKDFGSDFGQDSQYNSAFFYNIRQRYNMLFDQGTLIPGLDAGKLLVAEYLKNRQRTETNLAEAERRIDQLLELCRRYRRVVKNENESPKIVTDNTLNIAGAILVRFLATKGVGKW